MEERLEASSIVSDLLPASADPSDLSATQTRRLSTPHTFERRAVPVTFWHVRPRIASLNAGYPAPLQPWFQLWVGSTTALRYRSPRGDWRPSSVSADRRFATGYLALSRPVLRQCEEHERNAFRPMSASHFFDYEYSRLSCFQHLFETCVSPSLRALRPGGGTGGSCVSRRKDPLWRAFRVRAWRCRPSTPKEPCL